MTKFKKIFQILAAVAMNPRVLNHVLADDHSWEKRIGKKHGIKGGLPVAGLDVLCPDLNETLDVFAFLDGGSLPTDLVLLKCLGKRFPECSYFEIGTWRGESVANVASVAKECYTLNLGEQELTEKGPGKKWAEQTGFFSRNIPNIKQLFGNSMDWDFSSPGKKFDLIFIDGDHRYEMVVNDTRKVFKHLVHEKSIVVWHDYARTPEKYRPEVLAGILDGIPPESKKYLYHVSNTLCCVFLKEDLPVSPLVNPGLPEYTFRVNLEMRKTH